jgi:polyisoprenoid-binding protein YceI
MADQFTGLTEGTWTLDAAHTEVGFTVRHAGISKVRGGFNDVEGSLEVGPGLDDDKVRVAIKTGSIDTRSAQRDGHLASADFFDAEQFPDMIFESTSFSEETIEGTLTVKGITKAVTLDVEYGGADTDPFGQLRAGFSATTVINRTDFGLTWNAALESGKLMVGEKVTITIEAEFTAPALETVDA